MILADTSVWIDYFRDDLPELGERLRRGDVVMHPFVLGELACGNFSRRQTIFDLLQQLRCIAVAEHDEVMNFIEARRLYGRGIGFVDVHLLAAVAIERCQFWTGDKRLHAMALSLGIAIHA